MSKLFTRHRGKIPIKVLVDFSVHEASRLPERCGMLSVSWKRGKSSHSGVTRKVMPDGQKSAVWDKTFTFDCTFYKDPESRKIEEKDIAIELIEDGIDVKKKKKRVLGTTAVNLAEFFTQSGRVTRIYKLEGSRDGTTLKLTFQIRDKLEEGVESTSHAGVAAASPAELAVATSLAPPGQKDRSRKKPAVRSAPGRGGSQKGDVNESDDSASVSTANRDTVPSYLEDDNTPTEITVDSDALSDEGHSGSNNIAARPKATTSRKTVISELSAVDNASGSAAARNVMRSNATTTALAVPRTGAGAQLSLTASDSSDDVDYHLEDRGTAVPSGFEDRRASQLFLVKHAITDFDDEVMQWRYCAGVIPTPAALIDLSLKEWSMYSRYDPVFGDDIANALESTVRRVCRVTGAKTKLPALCFWLCSVGWTMFFVEEQLGDMYPDGDQPEEVTDFQDMLDRAHYAAYMNVVQTVGASVDAVLVATVLDQDNPFESRGTESQSAFFDVLNNALNTFTEAKLFPLIVGELFSQIFRHAASTLANTVYRSSRYMTCGSGLKLKMWLSAVDEWLSGHLEVNTASVRNVLTHIRQLANVLMMAKDALLSPEARTEACPDLTPAQLAAIFTLFAADEFDPTPINTSVYQKYVAQVEPKALSATAFVDDDVRPPGLDFFPTKTKRIQDLIVPAAFNGVKGFEFLSRH